MSFIVDCKSSSLYWNRTDITMLYFDDIKKFDLLTEEDEKKLFSLIKNGNESEKQYARNKIIESNQRFVVSVARRWSSRNNLLDLINEANIGLVKAIDTYDESKANRFITYAIWWIRKQLNTYIITKENQICSKNAHVVYTTVNRIKNEFYVKEGRYPTVDEIKTILENNFNYKLAYEEDLYDVSFQSIDEPYSSDSDDNSPTIEDNSEYSRVSSSCNIDDFIENEHVSNAISNILSMLSDKERFVITKLYGIHEQRPYRIDEIAKELGVSGERVRQIHFRALKRLRENSNTIKNAV